MNGYNLFVVDHFLNLHGIQDRNLSKALLKIKRYYFRLIHLENSDELKYSWRKLFK